MSEKISEQKERLELISIIKEKLFKEIEEDTQKETNLLIDLAHDNLLSQEQAILSSKTITINQRIKELFNAFSFMSYYAKYENFDNIAYITPIKTLKMMCADSYFLFTIKYKFGLGIFMILCEKDLTQDLFSIIEEMIFDKQYKDKN